jgi:hypothetical protein
MDRLFCDAEPPAALRDMWKKRRLSWWLRLENHRAQ